MLIFGRKFNVRLLGKLILINMQLISTQSNENQTKS